MIVRLRAQRDRGWRRRMRPVVGLSDLAVGLGSAGGRVSRRWLRAPANTGQTLPVSDALARDRDWTSWSSVPSS